jgi:hypothetical protein
MDIEGFSNLPVRDRRILVHAAVADAIQLLFIKTTVFTAYLTMIILSKIHIIKSYFKVPQNPRKGEGITMAARIPPTQRTLELQKLTETL